MEDTKAYIEKYLAEKNNNSVGELTRKLELYKKEIPDPSKINYGTLIEMNISMNDIDDELLSCYVGRVIHGKFDKVNSAYVTFGDVVVSHKAKELTELQVLKTELEENSVSEKLSTLNQALILAQKQLEGLEKAFADLNNTSNSSQKRKSDDTMRKMLDALITVVKEVADMKMSAQKKEPLQLTVQNWPHPANFSNNHMLYERLNERWLNEYGITDNN